MPVARGMPPTIIAAVHCLLKAINKYQIPKMIKNQQPILGHFHVTTVATKAAAATSPCIKESCKPNFGLNPSKMNRAKKMTIHIDKTLGR